MHLSAYHVMWDSAQTKRLPLHKKAVPEAVPMTKKRTCEQIAGPLHCLMAAAVIGAVVFFRYIGRIPEETMGFAPFSEKFFLDTAIPSAL